MIKNVEMHLGRFLDKEQISDTMKSKSKKEFLKGFNKEFSTKMYTISCEQYLLMKEIFKLLQNNQLIIENDKLLIKYEPMVQKIDKMAQEKINIIKNIQASG